MNYRKTHTNEAENTLQGPHFGDPILQRMSHTHSSCREGRWENIRSLISKNVPLTRLLQAREGQREAQVAFRKCQATWALGLILQLSFTLFLCGVKRLCLAIILPGNKMRRGELLSHALDQGSLVWLIGSCTISLAPRTDISSVCLK